MRHIVTAIMVGMGSGHLAFRLVEDKKWYELGLLLVILAGVLIHEYHTQQTFKKFK